MAMVTCPKCKRTVNSTANKCPNCGNVLSYSAFDKNAPKDARFHMLSNIFLGVSFVLLFMDFMNIAKTYAGGIVFGVGFLFQALSMLEKEKEKDFSGKKRGRLLFWISVVLILIGIGYLIFDLTH
jgi:hypothetical protein